MSVKHEDSIQRSPSPFLYGILTFLCKTVSRIFCRIKVKGELPEGPAIIVSNHTSNVDFILLIAAYSGRRINFLCTYHFFTFKLLNFFFKRLGVIPKFQFATDLEAFRKMKYVLSNNRGMVYIAPEGTIFANGKLGFISPSIAKMIRMFRVPVYAAKIEGAGLGMSKWAEKLCRTRVTVTTRKIVREEEAGKLSVDQIMDRIVENISYNDFTYQRKNSITSRSRNLAEGFETMYYKCPCCKSEFKLKTEGNVIECTNCGTKAVIGEDFRFKWNSGKKYFDNYIQWYDWQKKELENEMRKSNFKLEDEVDYGIDKPGVNNYVKVGRGVMTLTHEGWDYRGTYNGEEIHEHDDPGQVFLATLKVGKHFELPYRFGHCRVFYPDNGLKSMKWHLASRVMSELLAEKN